ncbi:MAG TPA: hypothetical protein VFQ91_20540 [Bryobacteraceae bacterium]|nr:hypothetical protein [Bryobacteraceae bacterium]
MRKVLLLSALSVAALLGMDPAARNVKSVYILRMGNGLDQFLASELSKHGVYTITTDPQKADALLTESLGEGFEKKYVELYPPPKPEPTPEEKAKAEKDKEENKSSEGKKADDVNNAPVQRVGTSTWGRGKGTIFLVARDSRAVLWSMNRQPKNLTTKNMVDQARKVVDQLRKDLGLTQPSR